MEVGPGIGGDGIVAGCSLDRRILPTWSIITASTPQWRWWFTYWLILFSSPQVNNNNPRLCTILTKSSNANPPVVSWSWRIGVELATIPRSRSLWANRTDNAKDWHIESRYIP